jgi:hypothetical protein
MEEIFFLDDDTIKLEGDIWPEMEKDLDLTQTTGPKSLCGN